MGRRGIKIPSDEPLAPRHTLSLLLASLTRSILENCKTKPNKPLTHMDRQARTGGTVLVRSREMTGRSQTLS